MAFSKVYYPCIVNNSLDKKHRPTKSLDGLWQLEIDPEGTGNLENFQDGKKDFSYKISVPGSVWAIDDLAQEYPSFQQPNKYEGTCWYKTSFVVDGKKWNNGKFWLKFGGVLPTASIWLNGQFLGYHNHPNVSVKFDATKAINAKGENVLVIEGAWRELEMLGGLVHAGPGIFRSVELEKTNDLRIEDFYIQPDMNTDQVKLAATVYNDSAVPKTFSLEGSIFDSEGNNIVINKSEKELSVDQERSFEIDFSIEFKDYAYWNDKKPVLYIGRLDLIEGKDIVDTVEDRFGMRQFTVKDKKLLLNNAPIFWRAVADEFNLCPTITPIVDKDLIRKRFEALAKMGFNGKRYHTHVPTQEELDVADEMGFLLSVEVPVISNFSEIKPYPLCKLDWEAKLKEIRNHPSVVVYCMGNEGSQKLYGLGYEKRVPLYYEKAKKLAPDLLVTCACGIQGEFPELPNDFESPHLWARYFKWAYDGLASVPFDGFEELSEKGPLIIHEYGKMTVWPDPQEDKFFKKYPLRGNYGEMGKIALKEAGLEPLLPEVIKNSRLLSAVCTKIAIEQIRRQKNVFGHQYHCAFRVGANRGFIDDTGSHIDSEFDGIVLSNSDTAVLIDRDFRGRTLYHGEDFDVALYISHFGNEDIKDSRIDWQFTASNNTLAKGDIKVEFFEAGQNLHIGQIKFDAPKQTGKFNLKAKLISGNKVIALNNWDFWVYPQARRKLPKKVFTLMKDKDMESSLMSRYINLYRLDDYYTTHHGVSYAWKDDFDEFASSELVKCILTDYWDDKFISYIEKGTNVLLFYGNHSPETWHPELTGLDVRFKNDIFKLYTPFRSGWDHGNQATIIEEHNTVENFTHDGWCDLQFFDMIQDQHTLKTKELPLDAKPIIRVIPIWKSHGEQAGPSPESPDIARPYATEDRAYLTESVHGKGKLIISSLKMDSESAGVYLLDSIINYLG